MAEKLELLNQVSESTEVSTFSSANITTITILVGLHPYDIGILEDMVYNFLINDCQTTKDCINDLKNERNEVNKKKVLINVIQHAKTENYT